MLQIIFADLMRTWSGISSSDSDSRKSDSSLLSGSSASFYEFSESFSLKNKNSSGRATIIGLLHISWWTNVSTKNFAHFPNNGKIFSPFHSFVDKLVSIQQLVFYINYILWAIRPFDFHSGKIEDYRNFFNPCFVVHPADIQFEKWNQHCWYDSICFATIPSYIAIKALIISHFRGPVKEKQVWVEIFFHYLEEMKLSMTLLLFRIRPVCTIQYQFYFQAKMTAGFLKQFNLISDLRGVILLPLFFRPWIDIAISIIRKHHAFVFLVAWVRLILANIAQIETLHPIRCYSVRRLLALWFSFQSTLFAKRIKLTRYKVVLSSIQGGGYS